MSGETLTTCVLGEENFLSEIVLLITIVLSFTYILAAFYWVNFELQILRADALEDGNVGHLVAVGLLG